MSDHTDERVTAIGIAADHIARGCRASTSHDPSSYLRQIGEALASLAADAAETQTLREQVADLRLDNARFRKENKRLRERVWSRNVRRAWRYRAGRDAAVADRDRLAEAAQDVINSAGVEMDDPRISYLVVQIDRQEWAALRAALTGREGSDDADDAEIARIVRERDAADTGERVTLDEVLAENGITRQRIEEYVAQPPVTVTPLLASCFLHGDYAGDECPECVARRHAADG